MFDDNDSFEETRKYRRGIMCGESRKCCPYDDGYHKLRAKSILKTKTIDLFINVDGIVNEGKHEID